ncbi:hypothetical protein [Burkholderia ubonensis]|uniref:hypothetical protein n=1 Tax=Burkholderia ubonensis TaxID=101571 RepID=UPI0007C75239|nr:hypothetical protein [Burkholderia ubonensis]
MRDLQKTRIEANFDKLREQLRIAVIFGGDRRKEGAVINATHNPRSDKSYEYVADDILQALKNAGFKHVIKLPEDMNLASELVRHDIDMCWLNSGGTQGTASVTHAPAMLELLGVPYVGHNPLNAGILDSKHIFKSLLVTMGIDTAKFLVFDPSVESDMVMQKRIDEAFGDDSGSFIVKPVSGRASQHVHHVSRRHELLGVIHDIKRATHGQVILEKYLSGREYTMASIGPVIYRKGRLVDHQSPFVFSGVERVLERDEKIFTSMDVKKISNDRLMLLNPTFDPEAWGKMAVATKRIFSELNLSAGIRVDFRADEDGNIHVLEANPKPDLKRPTESQTSFICAGLPQFDMTYEDLILSMLLNRIHGLVTYQPQMAPKLVSLLQPATA